MRIGLYNRWLRTAGGGEKYSLALAGVLARLGEVDLLAPEVVDLPAIADRLNLPSDGLRLRRVDGDESAVARVSAEYDLFLNATFMGLPKSRARRSVLVVYFPGKIFATPGARRKARFAQQLGRALAAPRFGEGFFAAEPFGSARVRWTNGHGHMNVRVPSSGQRWIELTLRGFEPRTPVELSLRANGKAYTHEVVARDEFAAFRIPLAPGLAGEMEVEIVSPPVDLATRAPHLGDGRVIGVLLKDVRVSSARNRMYRLLFERLLPGRRAGLENAAVHLGALAALQSYGLVIAISDFTREWIRRYWGRDAAMLYPPIDVDVLRPAEKEKLVLSVGRFFVGGHCKRQDVMVKAVRALLPRLPEDWRFVFAGGIGHRPEDRAYFEAVRGAAAGLPIEVLGDIGSDELRRLYQQAALYWHATGFVESGRPEPVANEHFGITTAEAMAAGAVPIVHGSGGQIEIVRNGVDGYLWTTLSELGARTLALAGDAGLRERMTHAAVERAQRFSRSAFETRATALVAPLLAPG